MRLIDAAEGHLFRLPPDNVVLLARPAAELPPPPVREVPRRRFVVYEQDGSVWRWDLLRSGWVKRAV